MFQPPHLEAQGDFPSDSNCVTALPPFIISVTEIEARKMNALNHNFCGKESHIGYILPRG
jgi:hypothetical protein